MTATCEGCGAVEGEILGSRFGVRCWRCYHTAVPPDEVKRCERIDYQRAVARAIRGILDVAGGRRRQALAARAFLLEIAESAAEARALLDEVKRLGVQIEGRP